MLSHQQSTLHIIPAARDTVESPLPSRSSELSTSWGLLGTAPCRWDAPEPRLRQERSPDTVLLTVCCMMRKALLAAVPQSPKCKCCGQSGQRELRARRKPRMVQGSKWEMRCSEKALSTSVPGHGHSLPVTALG